MDEKSKVERYSHMLLSTFPGLSELRMKLVSVREDFIELLLPFQDFMRRPDHIVAGPALMGLADVAMYAALVAHKDEALLAFTTQLNMNFLDKAEPGDLLGRARVLKSGASLATVCAEISNADRSKQFAFATGMFKIYPKKLK